MAHVEGSDSGLGSSLAWLGVQPVQEPVPRSDGLCPISRVWEASPTPISHCHTIRCVLAADIGVRDPSHNEFLGKARSDGYICPYTTDAAQFQHKNSTFGVRRGRGRTSRRAVLTR